MKLKIYCIILFLASTFVRKFDVYGAKTPNQALFSFGENHVKDEAKGDQSILSLFPDKVTRLFDDDQGRYVLLCAHADQENQNRDCGSISASAYSILKSIFDDSSLDLPIKAEFVALDELHDLIAAEYIPPRPCLLLLELDELDRTCLLSPDPDVSIHVLGATTRAATESSNARAQAYDALRLVESITPALHVNVDKVLDPLKRRQLYWQNNLYEPAAASGRAPNTCGELHSLPSVESFERDYLLPQRPLVIRGGCADWTLRQWSNARLRESFADAMVHTKIGEHGVFEGVEPIERWLSPTNSDSDAHQRDDRSIPSRAAERIRFEHLVVVRPASAKVSVDSLLRRIEEDTSARNASFYLEYTSLVDQFPSLMNDLKSPAFTQHLNVEYTNVWLGGDTIGKLHFDEFENVMCQVSGTKRWKLFSPSNNEQMYEGHLREADLEYDVRTDTFRREARQLSDSTAMVMSPIDLQSLDVERMPMASNALSRLVECEVREGDLFYLPAWWWHEVYSSRSLGAERRNMAVNRWYESVYSKAFPCASCRRRLKDTYAATLASADEAQHDNAEMANKNIDL